MLKAQQLVLLCPSLMTSSPPAEHQFVHQHAFYYCAQRSYSSVPPGVHSSHWQNMAKKQKMASCLALIALGKESVLMDCICKGLDGIDQSKSCAADLHSHTKQVETTVHVSICCRTAM